MGAKENEDENQKQDEKVISPPQTISEKKEGPSDEEPLDSEYDYSREEIEQRINQDTKFQEKYSSKLKLCGETKNQNHETIYRQIAFLEEKKLTCHALNFVKGKRVHRGYASHVIAPLNSQHDYTRKEIEQIMGI